MCARAFESDVVHMVYFSIIYCQKQPRNQLNLLCKRHKFSQFMRIFGLFYDDRLRRYCVYFYLLCRFWWQISKLTFYSSSSGTRHDDVGVAIVLEFKTQCCSLSFKYSHNYLTKNRMFQEEEDENKTGELSTLTECLIFCTVWAGGLARAFVWVCLIVTVLAPEVMSWLVFFFVALFFLSITCAQCHMVLQSTNYTDEISILISLDFLLFFGFVFFFYCVVINCDQIIERHNANFRTPQHKIKNRKLFCFVFFSRLVEEKRWYCVCFAWVDVIVLVSRKTNQTRTGDVCAVTVLLLLLLFCCWTFTS